jgi:hypothetical protein
MREVEKNGIMIDICPSCKGVWLDRGELEKLMSDVREVRQEYNEWYYGTPPNQPQQPAPYPPQPYPPAYQQPYYGSHPQGYPGYKCYPYKKYKKKKSVLDVLGDLFD